MGLYSGLNIYFLMIFFLIIGIEVILKDKNQKILQLL